MTSAPEYIDPRRDLAPVNGTPLALTRTDTRRLELPGERADRRRRAVEVAAVCVAVVALAVIVVVAGWLWNFHVLGG